ncbi:hypothetical protein M434DRAFT_38153 [Hypoxylon sp. CO27-5]|nr:hypothetical protein M434DRAFT_38153 [Hypoxylon sp. CO27-5]
MTTILAKIYAQSAPFSLRNDASVGITHLSDCSGDDKVLSRHDHALGEVTNIPVKGECCEDLVPNCGKPMLCGHSCKELCHSGLFFAMYAVGGGQLEMRSGEDEFSLHRQEARMHEGLLLPWLTHHSAPSLLYPMASISSPMRTYPIRTTSPDQLLWRCVNPKAQPHELQARRSETDYSEELWVKMTRNLPYTIHLSDSREPESTIHNNGPPHPIAIPTESYSLLPAQFYYPLLNLPPSPKKPSLASGSSRQRMDVHATRGLEDSDGISEFLFVITDYKALDSQIQDTRSSSPTVLQETQAELKKTEETATPTDSLRARSIAVLMQPITPKRKTPLANLVTAPVANYHLSDMILLAWIKARNGDTSSTGLGTYRNNDHEGGRLPSSLRAVWSEFFDLTLNFVSRFAVYESLSTYRSGISSLESEYYPPATDDARTSVFSADWKQWLGVELQGIDSTTADVIPESLHSLRHGRAISVKSLMEHYDISAYSREQSPALSFSSLNALLRNDLLSVVEANRTLMSRNTRLSHSGIRLHLWCNFRQVKLRL